MTVQGCAELSQRMLAEAQQTLLQVAKLFKQVEDNPALSVSVAVRIYICHILSVTPVDI